MVRRSNRTNTESTGFPGLAAICPPARSSVRPSVLFVRRAKARAGVAAPRQESRWLDILWSLVSRPVIPPRRSSPSPSRYRGGRSSVPEIKSNPICRADRQWLSIIWRAIRPAGARMYTLFRGTSEQTRRDNRDRSDICISDAIKSLDDERT